jgi:putative protein-disulfide isomerase
MDKPNIYYIYDAYCGWCFGFSKQMEIFYNNYKNKYNFIVLSANMIAKNQRHHVSKTAQYVLNAIPNVQKTTGVTFGADYLWHLQNPELSDWYIDSEKPALALTVFNKLKPNHTVNFAAKMQTALFAEGRDLCDNEAYRHILEFYKIDFDSFFEQVKSKEVIEETYRDFELVKTWGISGFPTLLVQTAPSKLAILAQGYATANELSLNIDLLLKAAQ